MTRLTSRFSTSKLPDTSDVRERILEAVEQAIDRVEDVVQDAPSPKEAADSLRRQRFVRSAGTTIIAVAPTVARVAKPAMTKVAKHRMVRRGSRRAVVVAPFAMRAHPVLLGVGLAATAVGGAFAVRRMLAKRADSSSTELERAHDRYVEDFDPTRFNLDEEVERMEDEGGEPSAGSSSSRERRFVRSGNGSARATQG